MARCQDRGAGLGGAGHAFVRQPVGSVARARARAVLARARARAVLASVLVLACALGTETSHARRHVLQSDDGRFDNEQDKDTKGVDPQAAGAPPPKAHQTDLCAPYRRKQHGLDFVEGAPPRLKRLFWLHVPKAGTSFGLAILNFACPRLPKVRTPPFMCFYYL